ncbi:MAG: zinc ribbon domain-containing protein [Gemmatimonadota bacterium]
MPTYEYRCKACQHDFEKFQRMSDEPGAECPACGGAAERRLSGGAGLLFKGSGFYITDYRSDSYKKAAGAESNGGGKSGDGKPGGDKGGSGEGGGTKASTDKSASGSKSDSKSSGSTKDD